MKYLKIFNKTHVILDEIEEYSGLKYTWTLNGMGKSEFNIPLESTKCTPENFEFRNHIEIWEGSTCIWGGLVVNREFQGGSLHVSCYGYLALLWKRRLRAKSYSEMTYGNLLTAMINDTNGIYSTGISIGTIQPGSLNTQRIVENKDYLLDKIQEYIIDGNYDIEVDNNRAFNFYTRKGQDKSKYELIYGSDADNILTDPRLNQSILEMSNSIYSESENSGSVLTSTAQDNASIGLYGFMEGEYSANSGIVIQNTLDNYVQGELQRRAYPINTLNLSIKDSSLCPFDDFAVGDTLSVNLIPYWNYKDRLRVLEITHIEDNDTRDITVGQTIYRPQKPQIKLYGR